MNSFETVQSLLLCLVTVFCLAEVSLFCFDRSVVHSCVKETSVTLPSDFLLSVFSLHSHFTSYCKYCISSKHSKGKFQRYLFHLTIFVYMRFLIWPPVFDWTGNELCLNIVLGFWAILSHQNKTKHIHKGEHSENGF